MWFQVIRFDRQVLLTAMVLALAFACCQPALCDAPQTVTDVIIGHNNKGPYTLSWTDIDLKSVVAIINGRTLRGGDYSIDNSKAMLGFSSVLLQDAIVRITYTTTAKSKRTGGATNVPVTLNILNNPNANLQVTGLHVQTDPKNPDAGKTIVGLTGGKSWSGSKLNSQFLMSQVNDDKNGAQGSAMDRSVIKLGGESQVGNATFTASMLSVGSKFGGEKEYALAAGKQESAFAVHFTPGKRVEANASIRSARDTAGAKDGTGTVTQEQNVIVSPTGTTKVMLAHSTTSSQTAAQGSNQVVETSGVSVNQKIGGGTSASVSMQNTSVNAGGKTEGTTTQQVSIASKPIDSVGVTAQVQQSNSDSQGSLLKTNTTVQVNPTKQVSLSASHATQESTQTGVATDTVVSFKAAAAGSTEFKGNLVQKNAGTQSQYQRDMSVTSRPLSYARVSAVFSQKALNDQEDVTKAAFLELTPIKNTLFGAGYKYVQNGSLVMTITDYSARTKPVSFLELSGSYRDREIRQDYAPDTTKVQIALAPFSFFSLRGGYQANPEDDKGNVQTYQATTAGVKVRVGNVGLTADLSQKDEYKVGQQSEEHIFGAEMPIFGRGKFTTGYKTARLFGVTGGAADTYTMGYCHDMGSVFNISLTGNYTQYRYNSADPSKEQIDANASVGIKF